MVTTFGNDGARGQNLGLLVSVFFLFSFIGSLIFEQVGLGPAFSLCDWTQGGTRCQILGYLTVSVVNTKVGLRLFKVYISITSHSGI